MWTHARSSHGHPVRRALCACRRRHAWPGSTADGCAMMMTTTTMTTMLLLLLLLLFV
jgi:hypothetical protein